MKIITVDNFQECINSFDRFDHAIFFGKGPTFDIVSKKTNKDMIVCLNHTANFIDDIDLLVCNDLDCGIESIKKEKFKDIKNILIPFHIHVNCGPRPNISYIDVINRIEEYFSGNLIVYNLSTTKPYPNHISLKTRTSTGHTAIEFVTTFLKTIQNITTYGIANRPGYNSSYFEGKSASSSTSSNNFHKFITEICKRKNIKCLIN